VTLDELDLRLRVRADGGIEGAAISDPIEIPRL